MSRSLNYLLPKNFKTNFPYSFEILRFIKNNDIVPFIKFILLLDSGLSLTQRLSILKNCFTINTKVNSPHRQHEILSFIIAMCRTRKLNGNYVECGCFKGSSTSKFSLVAKLLNKKLFVLDSFEGIPENDENHDFNIYGEKSGFRKGDFMGTLDEVKQNINNYGSIDNCSFIKGWFENTLPTFNEKLNAIYIDVDLASSTKDCLKHLYKNLNKEGIIMSQDGHLPLVIDVFRDQEFWKNELNIEPPNVVGLGKEKLIYFKK